MFTGIIEAMGTVADIKRRTDGSAVLTIDAGSIVADLPRGGSLAVNGVCLTAVPTPASLDPAPTACDPAQADRREGAQLRSRNPQAAAGHPLGEEEERLGHPDGQVKAGAFTADVMGETLRLTSLGALAPGNPVNLERCLSPAGRFDGHIVQGHVDGIGTLDSITDHGSWAVYRFTVPQSLAPYTALKGSIAIDGVSLTISGASAPDAPKAQQAPDAPAAPGANHEASHWVEVSLIPATRAHTILGTAEAGQTVNIEVDVFAKYAERLAGFRAAAVSAPDAHNAPTAHNASTAPDPTSSTPPASTTAASTEGALS